MEPQLLITGCRRSGTTLLQAMLSQHPGLLVHPKEPQFILEGRDRFGDQIRDSTQAVRYLTSHPYFPESVDGGTFAYTLQRQKSIPYSEFVSKYLEACGGKPEPVQYRAADPARLEAWRRHLSSTELAVIERKTPSEMEYWAFPATDPGVSPLRVAARTSCEETFDLILRSGRRVKRWGYLLERGIGVHG